AFSAGHDLKELNARRSDEDRGRAYFKHIMSLCSRLMQQIVTLPQPVIAAVQATATAAGCPPVATCELAVASTDAKIATPRGQNSQHGVSISACSARRRWLRCPGTCRASMP